MAGVKLKPFSLDRMVEAVEAVRDRLLRASAALEKAGIAYAVVGGNAVAAWVSRVDRAAVRNTQDVDIMIRRADFPAVMAAMEAAGFIHAEVLGVDMFRDGPDGKPRDAVHILFANEKVRENDPLPNPDVANVIVAPEAYRVLALEELVRMKLISYRRKDQVHIDDLIDLKLVDAAWCDRLPSELVERLRHLLATPGA
jgi:hypothetical protein